jgi:aminopeptidase-like protein
MTILDNHPDRAALETEGTRMLALLDLLWPIHRSLAGPGIRETLAILGSSLDGFTVMKVASGSRVLDWIVPDEWHLQSAFLEAPDGRRLCDVAENTLHVVGYSTAVDKSLSLVELQPHLYSLPDQPDAIPYVTSYYERKWGFCLSHRQRDSLPEGTYRVRIDATHVAGTLDYGQLVLPGRSDDEILFSTYCCHPSMANNELSGPVIAVALAEWLASQPDRRYTYRFLFVPEMIGSAAVLETQRAHLQSHVRAAFNLTCVGDERAWSFLPSRMGDTYADHVASHVLRHAVDSYDTFVWRDRGSDESMYCAPGIDIPMVSIMRSKYGTYPEYHTSLDTPGRVVTARGLAEMLGLLRMLVETLEEDCTPRALVLGEPQLGRRGLYPQTSIKGSTAPVKDLLDLISHADGRTSLLDIAVRCDRPLWSLLPHLDALVAAGVMERTACA